MAHPNNKQENKSENSEQVEERQPVSDDSDLQADPTLLTKKVEELEKSVKELQDKYIRALAEIENIQRRALKEQEDAAKFGATLLAKDIICFVDNLERAAKCCPKCNDNKEVSSFVEGIHIIVKDILSSLEKHGIKKVESTGKVFNPEFHQAVAEVEAEDHDSGVVVETLQTGYTLNGRLIRAATVTVAK